MIRDNIQKAINKKIKYMNNKNIVILGTGSISDLILHELQYANIKVQGFVEFDVSNHNKEHNHNPIFKPIELKKRFGHNIYILVATSNKKLWIDTLLKLGYKKSNILIILDLKYKHKKAKRIVNSIATCSPIRIQSMINKFFLPHWCRSHKEEAEVIKRNQIFNQKYQGKRCFILGNGPSLKSVDLESLKNDYVFITNSFMKIEGWEKVNPNFYVCEDESFFQASLDGVNWNCDSVNTELLKLKNIKDLKCIFPIFAKKYIEYYRIQNVLDVHYFFDERYLRNWIQEQNLVFHRNMNIDMTKAIPVSWNVVDLCIYCALYMGFSEIVLVGCDTTSIQRNIDVTLGNEINEHYCYIDKERNSETVQNARLKNKGMIGALFNTYIIFKTYTEYSNYCSKNKIKFYNCSTTTLLDCIERKSLDDVINEEVS